MNPFSNMFKTTPVTPPTAAPAPGTPGAQPVTPSPEPAGTAKLADATPGTNPVVTEGTAPNGVVPDNVQTPENPLDQFKGLWDTDPSKQVPGEFTPDALDPTKLQEVIAKTSMTQVVTPELMAKISAGGEGATEAMMASMNLVAQQTLMQSTTVANKMIESQVTKAIEAMTAKIPGLVKAQSVNSALVEQNPIYANPAVAPVMDAVKSQLLVQHPNATAPQLTSMAQDFVKAMGSQLNPVATPASDTPVGDTDWTAYLETGNQ